jgi:hypothetical protein
MKAKIEFYLEPELKDLLIETIKSKGNIENISQVMRRLVYEYVVEEHINKVEKLLKERNERNEEERNL